MSLLDSLLDRTVALSFDRSGFLRHQRRFVAGDLDVDLSGRVIIVTGASSGIGLATAHALARLKARVLMVGRDKARTEAAVASVRAAVPGAQVRAELLDVSHLAACRAWAAALPEGEVHGLIHNAGALVDRVIRTPEGFESTLACHVLGPMVLTEALAPRLIHAQDARVVFVASGGMYSRRLDVDTLHHDQDKGFDGVQAYADAKRAQVVLSEQLAARFNATGVTFNTMHPGWADTPGVEKGLPTFHRFTAGRLRSPEEGADTVIWLVACPRIRGEQGKLWLDRAPQPTHMLPWTREDEAERDKLWAQVHAWAGVDPGWTRVLLGK
jgi:NAD(P)-dependent dehydrogenase (short-subunit alcohol dehydrogenase family)